MSLAEDAAVGTGIWLTMTHPLIVAALALVAVILCVVIIRLTWSLLRKQFTWLSSRVSPSAGTLIP